VKGIVRGADGAYAMVEAPCSGCTTLRAGQKLRDGYVKAIERDRVVFVQVSGDPVDSSPRREVVKTLRGFDSP